jgi:hypothetical protein
VTVQLFVQHWCRYSLSRHIPPNAKRGWSIAQKQRFSKWKFLWDVVLHYAATLHPLEQGSNQVHRTAVDQAAEQLEDERIEQGLTMAGLYSVLKKKQAEAGLTKKRKRRRPAEEDDDDEEEEEGSLPAATADEEQEVQAQAGQATTAVMQEEAEQLDRQLIQQHHQIRQQNNRRAREYHAAAGRRQQLP